MKQLIGLIIIFTLFSANIHAQESGRLSNKPAASVENPYNGMGYVVLEKQFVNGNNIPVLKQKDFNKANTIYIIRYDFTLIENIRLQADCILKFEGGSLRGPYSLIGNNTRIEADQVKLFNNDVKLAGNWNVYSWNICWFGASSNIKDNSPFIKRALDVVYSLGTQIANGYGFNDCGIFIPSGVFKVACQIEVNSRFNIFGNGTSSVIYSSCPGDLFVIKGTRGTISISNVSFHCDHSVRNKSNCITLNTEQGTALGRITNCDFVNYNIALNLETPYWLRITSCNFVYSNEYAIKAKNANSFSIVNSVFRSLDNNPSASHLFFTGDMQGVCITGCDFSGAYKSSLVLDRANGYGIQITGNYFEPCYSSSNFGGLLEIINGSVTDLMFKANGAYESNAFDKSIRNTPRFYIILRNTALYRCDIVGNVIVDGKIYGNSSSLVGRLYSYTDFSIDKYNLFEEYINIITNAKQAKTAKKKDSLLKEMKKCSERIQEKMLDNIIISNNITNYNHNYSYVFSSIRNVENNVEYNNLEYNAGSSRNRPSRLNVFNGKQYYDFDLRAPIYYYDSKWVTSDGATAGVPKSGPYSKRPSPNDIYEGFQYFNTDTHKTITWGDGKWWNPDGTEAKR